MCIFIGRTSKKIWLTLAFLNNNEEAKLWWRNLRKLQHCNKIMYMMLDKPLRWYYLYHQTCIYISWRGSSSLWRNFIASPFNSMSTRATKFNTWCTISTGACCGSSYCLFVCDLPKWFPVHCNSFPCCRKSSYICYCETCLQPIQFQGHRVSYSDMFITTRVNASCKLIFSSIVNILFIINYC